MKLYKLRDYVVAVKIVRAYNRGKVRQLVDNLDKINSEMGEAEVQLFNAENILDEEHVKIALVNAVMSFNSPNRAARTLRMEMLLKLAATDQVREAISKLGVKEGTEKIGILAIAHSRKNALEVLTSIEELLNVSEELEFPLLTVNRVEVMRKFYKITEKEIESTQARDYAEALRLALAHRIATARL